MSFTFSKSIIALAALIVGSNVLALTSADLQAKGLTALTGAEIKTLADGNTLDHKMMGTRLVAPIFYGANGMRVVNATAFGGKVSSTKWWVENDMRCEVNVRNGQNQCGTITKTDEGYTLCYSHEPQCSWTFTIREGNPDKMTP